MCEVLVRSGAKMVKNGTGDTPLHVAISQRRAPIKLALRLYETSTLEVLNLNLLGKRDAKQTICSLLKEIINEKDSSGDIALNRALVAEGTGNTEVYVWVKSLLRINGQELESSNACNQTPLHIACIIRSPLLKELIRQSAGALTFDIFGNTPMHYLCTSGGTFNIFEGEDENVEIFKPNNSGWMPIHLVAYFNNLEGAKSLISAANKVGLDEVSRLINCVIPASGKTALMIACERGHLEICQILVIQASIKKDHRDTLLGTAVDWAFEFEQFEIAKLLFNKGFADTMGMEDQARLMQRVSVMDLNCQQDFKGLIDKKWKR